MKHIYQASISFLLCICLVSCNSGGSTNNSTTNEEQLSIDQFVVKLHNISTVNTQAESIKKSAVDYY